ncbi:MAG: amino acid--tRNA ligase-related protein, partial [Pseudomonadales bacterium]
MAEVAELVDAVLGAGDYETLPFSQLLASSPLGDECEQDLRISAAIETLQAQRVFITDYPAEQAALARLRPENPSVAARFEMVVNGVELANGYHELGDPAQLRARFAADNDQRQAMGKPVLALDHAFLAAMAAGLPDCAGVALGVDRLVMLALASGRLQDVLTFVD